VKSPPVDITDVLVLLGTVSALVGVYFLLGVAWVLLIGGVTVAGAGIGFEMARARLRR
jgi:hypothetical protein